ncbi:MAG: alpha/beta fold hydrolase [Actinomycetota bacterium]
MSTDALEQARMALQARFVTKADHGASPSLQPEWIDHDGIRTRYWEAGRGEPLVLVHGGGAGADALGNWVAAAPLLARHFHLFAVDMLGFGETESIDGRNLEYTHNARVGHLRSFLDALGLGPVALVGNSMGGMTALGLAMDTPHRVSALVLLGSAGLGSGVSPELQRILEYREPDFDAMRRIVQGLTHPEFEPDEALVRYRFELTRREATMTAYSAMMQQVQKDGGLHCDEAAVAGVKVPTLVIAGREDAVVLVEEAVKFNQLLENSWLYVVPKCGHWVMIERPRDFAGSVLRFLGVEESLLLEPLTASPLTPK